MPTHYKGTKAEERMLNTIIKVLRSTNALEKKVSSFLTGHNLTMTQFDILEMLLHLGPLCHRQLAEKTLSTAGNITSVTNTLVAKKWVKRVRSKKDRREVRIQLTQIGEKHIQTVFHLHVKEMVAYFSVLTPQQQLTLGTLSAALGLQTKLQKEK